MEKQIKDKLELLRKRWKEEPEKRKIIEIQAKCLKLALEKKEKVEDIYEVAKKLFR